MKFQSDDITRLIRACRMYQDQTGSEYMWEQYEKLIEKLEYYEDENNVGQCTQNHTFKKSQMNVLLYGGSGIDSGKKSIRGTRSETKVVPMRQ